ncbi:RNA polymerase sigma factor [Brevirhabdus sp.]|uniref:RNA polymerase sigma factor n=1 Tax=Brevirhabdus sp. TaxID=2004514 RepID=UPI00405A2904
MDMAFDSLGDASDDTLLVLYANGDPQAARTLSLRLVPRMNALARRMLGDRAEAEDVTQDAMLRLWQIAPDWRPGGAQVSTWLYRVTVNLCTDRLRRRRGTPLDAIEEPRDDAPSVEQAMLARSRQEALDRALQQLPERQRQAVVLRHIEGLPNPEIATILDVGVEAVESLTARGKRALKTALSGRRNELGFDDG